MSRESIIYIEHRVFLIWGAIDVWSPRTDLFIQTRHTSCSTLSATRLDQLDVSCSVASRNFPVLQ